MKLPWEIGRRTGATQRPGLLSALVTVTLDAAACSPSRRFPWAALSVHVALFRPGRCPSSRRSCVCPKGTSRLTATV